MRRFFLFLVIASSLALGACAKDKKVKDPVGDPSSAPVDPDSAPSSEPASEPAK